MARHRLSDRSYRLLESARRLAEHGSTVGLVSQARHDDAWWDIVVHGVRLF